MEHWWSTLNGHGIPGRIRWPRTSICSQPSQQAVQFPQVLIVVSFIRGGTIDVERRFVTKSVS
jgi:hypothetical protein